MLVSSLDYCPSLTSLALGYNTGLGAHQSGHPRTRVQLRVLQGAVTHLAWQEPTDDPRHICYYWVVRGGQDCGVSVASLKILAYQERGGLGWGAAGLYKGFQGASLRFEYPLGAEPARGEVGQSQCLDIQ